MGCRCCRMIKSYIYDPSVPVDIPGRKRDTATGSLYQQKSAVADATLKVQGFHNFGYSSKCTEGQKPGPGKRDADNNHINRLHAAPLNPDCGVKASHGESDLFILSPDQNPQKCVVPIHTQPSLSPSPSLDPDAPQTEIPNGHIGYHKDEEEENGEQGGAEGRLPGDGESVEENTADITYVQTDGADGRTAAGTSASDEGDCGSVTDHEVAEALAALDAAMEGEDYE